MERIDAEADAMGKQIHARAIIQIGKSAPGRRVIGRDLLPQLSCRSMILFVGRSCGATTADLLTICQPVEF